MTDITHIVLLSGGGKGRLVISMEDGSMAREYERLDCLGKPTWAATATADASPTLLGALMLIFKDVPPYPVVGGTTKLFPNNVWRDGYHMYVSLPEDKTKTSGPGTVTINRKT